MFSPNFPSVFPCFPHFPFHFGPPKGKREREFQTKVDGIVAAGGRRRWWSWFCFLDVVLLLAFFADDQLRRHDEFRGKRSPQNSAGALLQKSRRINEEHLCHVRAQTAPPTSVDSNTTGDLWSQQEALLDQVKQLYMEKLRALIAKSPAALQESASNGDNVFSVEKQKEWETNPAASKLHSLALETKHPNIPTVQMPKTELEPSKNASTKMAARPWVSRPERHLTIQARTTTRSHE